MNFDLHPKLSIRPPMTLVGLRTRMTFARNLTGPLWKAFMERKSEVNFLPGMDRYSVAVYPSGFFIAFDPSLEFEKWATVEASPGLIDNTSTGMELLSMPGGLYAVFRFKGSSERGDDLFSYIFTQWLPQSGYQLDDRPHFEVLGALYKKSDPESEEDIWIPIRTND